VIRCSWEPVSQELQPEGGKSCPGSSNPLSESRFMHVLTVLLFHCVAIPLLLPPSSAPRPNARSRSPTRAEWEGAHPVLLADSRGVHAQRMRLLRIAPFHWYSSIPLHFLPKNFHFMLFYKYIFFHVPVLPNFLPFFFSHSVSSSPRPPTQPFHWTYEAEQRSLSLLCRSASSLARHDLLPQQFKHRCGQSLGEDVGLLLSGRNPA